MFAMRNDSPLAVIWRRKGIIIAVFLAFTVTTAVVSKTLDKVYETHATLFITLPSDTQSFDTVQASQAFARSFATVLDSPNIAQRVADQIGGDNEDDPQRDQVRAGARRRSCSRSPPRTRAPRARRRSPTAGRQVATDYAKTQPAGEHAREHHAGRRRAAAASPVAAQADALHAARRHHRPRARHRRGVPARPARQPPAHLRGRRAARSTPRCSRASRARAARTPPRPRSARRSGCCAPTSSSRRAARARARWRSRAAARTRARPRRSRSSRSPAPRSASA